MDLGQPVEALGEEDLDLLDIALRPAAVTRGEVNDGRRGFFVRPNNVARDLDPPTGAAQERGFNEIVAQDLAAQRLLARKVGQGGVRCKRRKSDDRVMAPEVSSPARPPGQAGAEQAAMYAQRQLLGPCRIGPRAHDDRQRLDQRRAWSRIHAVHQLENGFRRDEAVRVKFQHVLVTAAPALDEIVDVTLLLLRVLAAAAIPEGLVGAARHQLLHRLFLDLCEGRVRRVRNKKDLEALLGVEVLERVPHRLSGGDDLGRLFLVERDNDSGLAAAGDRLVRVRRRLGRGQQHQGSGNTRIGRDAEVEEVGGEERDGERFE